MPSVTREGECVARPFSFRVQLIRGQAQASVGRRRTRLLRLAVTGLTVLGLSQLLPLPSAFGQTYYGGNLTATINIFQPTRSIALNAQSLVFGPCQTGQTAPPNV